jgi:opacity protein-like surface antigen
MDRSQRFLHQPSTWLAAAIVLLLGAGVAQAQGYSGDRTGRWEFNLSPLYQTGKTLNFDGGTTVKTKDEFGFELGFGYNLNEQFVVGFNFDWYSVGYDANVVKEDGSKTGISGTYDSWVTNIPLTMYFAEGPLQPYATVGIGWSWIDTHIPTGLPQNICYWDPWWGYICTSTYPTKTSSNFTYSAGLGLRYQVNPSFYTRLGYDSKWLDMGKANGTPRFDQFRLDFGWVF